jgi:hypothetical protein
MRWRQNGDARHKQLEAIYHPNIYLCFKFEANPIRNAQVMARAKLHLRIGITVLNVTFHENRLIDQTLFSMGGHISIPLTP